MASVRSLRGLAALAGLLGALTVSVIRAGGDPEHPERRRAATSPAPSRPAPTPASASARASSRPSTALRSTSTSASRPRPRAAPTATSRSSALFHGWGGSKLRPHQRRLDRRRLRLLLDERPRLGQLSCGGTDPKRTQPVCAERLQPPDGHALRGPRRAGDLRGARRPGRRPARPRGEGLIDPQEIGVTGGSYGGGISMALAALKNRKMIPAGDGTLIPWVSDGGKPMRIAAAQPDIPWTDLAYSLQPNGHTLDYVVDSPYMQRGRIGVMKQSFVSGLYATGQATQQLRAAGHRPRRRPDHLVRVHQRRRALRHEPALAGHRRRDHDASLVLLHRRLDLAGAAADLERLDRRPVPARRGDPLLQPDARRRTPARRSR